MNEHYRNVPVLVTGGAGFIGSHLVHRLVQADARVTVLDDLSTGKEENLQNLMHNITFIRGCVTDLDTCLQASHGVQIVFHLAAAASVPESMQDPLKYHRANTTGTAALLEACARNGVQTFLFSSSAAVYGAATDVCREDSSCAPLSPYGLTKLMGEWYCRQYTNLFGLRTIILRYFNVYGPGQNPNTITAIVSNALATHQPVTIFGDGTQKRDFVHVNDVVTANLALAQSSPSGADETFNIGSGQSITLLELVKRLRPEYPQSRSPIEFLPARAGDIHASIADCSKLQRALEIAETA